MMNQPDPIPDQIPAGLSVGDSLRTRREQLGWSLTDIASWLRIKVAYLQALEDGRPQDLPGSTYALGFLRSYGATLGLDPADLSRRFRQETRGLDRRQALSFPAPVAERGVPAGAALLIGVVLIGVAYTGWYMAGGHESLPAQSVPPLPASLAPYVAEPPHPAAAAPEARSVAPPRTPAPADPGGHAAVAEPAGVPPPAAVEPPPSQAPVQVTVKASASSWVQVRQVGGPVIYERILQPGESWPVPAGHENLLMSTGNAGGITLSAGDVSTPILGPPGAVRRNLPLSADAIRDGTLLARADQQRPIAQQSPAQQPLAQQTGQSPPFLAGSGHGATLPAPNGGQSYPEH